MRRGGEPGSVLTDRSSPTVDATETVDRDGVDGPADGGGRHRRDDQPAPTEAPAADETRTHLVGKVWDRLTNVFRSEAVDPEQLRREQAERERYERTLQRAQRRYWEATEADARVRDLRQEIATHTREERRALADAAAMRAEAGDARTAEALARSHARLLPGSAEPGPHQQPAEKPADRLNLYADQRADDARRAEDNARQSVERAAQARANVAVAEQAANEITATVSRRLESLWRWVNFRAEDEAGFQMVDEDRPGPVSSALTGRDEPPPVWRNRPYGQSNGLRRVLHVDQVRLERMLDDGRGGYQRTPDPTGPWLRHLNAFGIDADPTRTQNCNDTVASLFDTYVHGRPTVAAPRTFDGYLNGDARQPWWGEGGGPGRMEDLTNGRYQALAGDLSTWPPDASTARIVDAFAQLHQQVLAGGHGSFASIVTGWRDGGSHAWAAVNHNGVIHFIDPQRARVVVALPGDGGLRYIDGHTGEPVPHPVYDPGQIVAMDALVVDADARPMPFADRPAGTWNERPLTPEYLAKQPPEVQAAAWSATSHEVMRTERGQAAAYARQAAEARQAEEEHARRAESLRQRVQLTVEQETVHRDKRDVAWEAAKQADRAAAQHGLVARQATEQQAYGPGEQRYVAQQRAAWHEAAAHQLQQEAHRLRAEAEEHEDRRREAEVLRQRTTHSASEAEVRRTEFAEAARSAEQAAATSDRQAVLAETYRLQYAEQAARGYRLRADWHRQEAARHRQAVAGRGPDDPVRVHAEGRAHHHQRLAEAAQHAGDHHLAIRHRVSAAEWREWQAVQYSQQAEQLRHQASAHDRDATEHEQHRDAAAARARAYAATDQEFRRAAESLAARDPHLAERYREQADAYRRAAQEHGDHADRQARAAEESRVRSAADRRDAEAADRAATTERETAGAERAAIDGHLKNASAWQRELWRRQNAANSGTAVPGASGPGAAANRPDHMFRDPTPEDLDLLGVGRVSLEDLGVDPASISPEQHRRWDRVLRRTALLPPEGIRFTQRSVSPDTSDRITASDLIRDMRDGGWRGEPMHGVRWGDGSFSSLDNRRLRAAREVGLDRIPLVVHGPGERLDAWDDDWPPGRGERQVLGVDIRELSDGRWVVGGDEGRIVYPSGTVAETFGEAAVFRAAEQRSLLPARLFGAERPPVLLDKPGEPADLPDQFGSVPPALRDAIDKASEAAPTVAKDLKAIARTVTSRLGLAEGLTLKGEEDRVKGLDSLVRKYWTEGEPFGLSPEDFLQRVNDIVRFSLQLPGAELYLPSVDAVRQGLAAEDYQVTDTKNFWQAGNRYFGLNLTLRTPDGRLLELQLPTAPSWRANKLTHDLYAVFRDPDESPVRQVHALMGMLQVNRRLGLPDLVPPGLAERWEPTDTSLARWAVKNPDSWRGYRAWLADNGWQFRDVVAEFGLDGRDLPVSDDVAEKWGEDDVQLLRALQG